jgi:hypothetical protein
MALGKELGAAGGGRVGRGGLHAPPTPADGCGKRTNAAAPPHTLAPCTPPSPPKVGFESYGTDLPEDATEEQVLDVVARYNSDPNVHGILVQLPVGGVW